MLSRAKRLTANNVVVQALQEAVDFLSTTIVPSAEVSLQQLPRYVEESRSTPNYLAWSQPKHPPDSKVPQQKLVGYVQHKLLIDALTGGKVGYKTCLFRSWNSNWILRKLPGS